MVLEKTLESPDSQDLKEIKPVNPKGNLSEYSLEWLMLKRKVQYFSHLMRLIRNDWERLKGEEKGTTEDEMVGWHRWLNGQSLSKLREMERAGKPASIGSQRVEQDWATEQQHGYKHIEIYMCSK